MKSFTTILALHFALTSAMVLQRDTMVSNTTYNCMTLGKWENMTNTCAHNCETYALPNDGCDVDDFVCHCTNWDKINSLFIPCFTTPGGVNATCSSAQIDKYIGNVTSMCTYLNSTKYDAYLSCPLTPFDNTS